MLLSKGCAALVACASLVSGQFVNPSKKTVVEVGKSIDIKWEQAGLVAPLSISLIPGGTIIQESIIIQRVAVNIGNIGLLTWTADERITALESFSMVIIDARGVIVVSDQFVINHLHKKPHYKHSKLGYGKTVTVTEGGGHHTVTKTETTVVETDVPVMTEPPSVYYSGDYQTGYQLSTLPGVGEPDYGKLTPLPGGGGYNKYTTTTEENKYTSTTSEEKTYETSTTEYKKYDTTTTEYKKYDTTTTSEEKTYETSTSTTEDKKYYTTSTTEYKKYDTTTTSEEKTYETSTSTTEYKKYYTTSTSEEKTYETTTSSSYTPPPPPPPETTTEATTTYTPPPPPPETTTEESSSTTSSAETYKSFHQYTPPPADSTTEELTTYTPPPAESTTSEETTTEEMTTYTPPPADTTTEESTTFTPPPAETTEEQTTFTPPPATTFESSFVPPAGTGGNFTMPSGNGSFPVTAMGIKNVPSGWIVGAAAVLGLMV